MKESLPIQQFFEALETLIAVRDEFDCILTGHTRECLEDASLYEAHKAAVKEVIEGKMMRIRSMSGLVELPRHILIEKIFEELYIKIKRKNGTWKK